MNEPIWERDLGESIIIREFEGRDLPCVVAVRASNDEFLFRLWGMEREEITLIHCLMACKCLVLGPSSFMFQNFRIAFEYWSGVEIKEQLKAVLRGDV